ncbi:MAG: hypothetical protein ACYTGV_18050, partial [Planctomycetota bacterium]
VFGIHADGWFLVHVTGSVVEAPAGRPVAGAWVMTLPRHELAEDREHVDKWRQRIGLGNEPMLFYGGTRTDGDGTFSIHIYVGWGWQEGGISGLTYGARTPPPFTGPDCLLVDAEGMEKTVADLKEGDWEEASDQAGLFAQLRLGTVRVRRK